MPARGSCRSRAVLRGSCSCTDRRLTILTSGHALHRLLWGLCLLKCSFTAKIESSYLDMKVQIRQIWDQPGLPVFFLPACIKAYHLSLLKQDLSKFLSFNGRWYPVSPQLTQENYVYNSFSSNWFSLLTFFLSFSPCSFVSDLLSLCQPGPYASRSLSLSLLSLFLCPLPPSLSAQKDVL